MMHITTTTTTTTLLLLLLLLLSTLRSMTWSANQRRYNVTYFLRNRVLGLANPAKEEPQTLPTHRSANKKTKSPSDSSHPVP
jgi:hypothetical protein